MTDDKNRSKGSPVPSHRLSRLARLGGMAAGVAGGMLLDGARQLAEGRRPSVGDLLMTPANALRVTNQLSHLRGAAMKLGQLISMDAGELLPPELATILSRLRADAQPMPQRQVQSVLDTAWGPGWLARFSHFSFAPLAAASIGQVHRARTMDGRDLAIKIQYPGIRRSIDSDVVNVASLLSLSGLVPKTLDIKPLLAQAKRQLHEEADYEREGRCLAQFSALLAGSADFTVPELATDLTRPDVLAMSYVDGVPIESRGFAPQAERDRIARLAITLVLRELFEFQLMQTDPNFANYRTNTTTGRLVLLDFGATRAFQPETADIYRRLLRAGLAGDRTQATEIALEAGFFDPAAPVSHREAVMDLFDLAMRPMRSPEPFDFARSDLIQQLQERGTRLAAQRQSWHVPPIDLMFLQRKIGGTYLLASRLKAKLALRPLLEPFV